MPKIAEIFDLTVKITLTYNENGSSLLSKKEVLIQLISFLMNCGQFIDPTLR